MGLDMYAVNTKGRDEPELNPACYYWRQHSRLQQFFHHLYVHRTGRDPAELCGHYFELREQDIRFLKKLIEDSNLPYCPGGPGFGEDFQDENMEAYRQKDLEFCDWALKEIKAGESVYFTCEW